jgi:hypothetical protein
MSATLTPPAELADDAVEVVDRYGEVLIVVRSCTGTWWFNVARGSYAVATDGTDPLFIAPEHWRPFVDLRFAEDDPGFHVTFDDAGQTGVWGYRHREECPRCGVAHQP